MDVFSVLDIKNWMFRSIGCYGETKKRPPKQTEQPGILFIVEVIAMFCWGDPSRVRNSCVVIRGFWVGKAMDSSTQL